MSTIAIFGLNGAIGPHTIAALTSEPFSSKVKFPLRLFTGKEKPANTSEKEYYNYNDETEIAKGLEDVDVLVDLRKVSSDDLGPAAKKAGVKAYILSEFGIVHEGADFDSFSVFHAKTERKAKIQSYGLKAVDITTSFFVDWVWGLPLALQIDLPGQKLLAPNKDKKISVLFLKDLGKVIASVATKPAAEIKSNIHVSGDVITPGEAAAYYEKASGKTLTYEPLSSEQWAEVGKEVLQGKGRQPGFLWLLGFISATTDDRAYFAKNDNEYVNGGLFEWTKFEPEALKNWAGK